ncbi:hypothetical protein [Antarctic microvirus CAA_003_V_9]|nr:hypothetical protein [Antarctic microvirus CAA_003_V_9]
MIITSSRPKAGKSCACNQIIYCNNNKMQHTQNFKFKPEHMEHPTGVSLTLPDQSMSVKTIYDRFARGQSINQKEYTGGFFEEEIPNLKKLDLVELQELSRNNQSQIEILREQLKTQEEQYNFTQKLERKAELKKQLEDINLETPDDGKPDVNK